MDSMSLATFLMSGYDGIWFPMVAWSHIFPLFVFSKKKKKREKKVRLIKLKPTKLTHPSFLTNVIRTVKLLMTVEHSCSKLHHEDDHMHEYSYLFWNSIIVQALVTRKRRSKFKNQIRTRSWIVLRSWTKLNEVGKLNN